MTGKATSRPRDSAAFTYFGCRCLVVLNSLRRFVYIMADEEGVADVDDEKPEDQTVKKAAKHDSVKATDLEKVTDYVEEAEISSNNISDVRKKLLGSVCTQVAVVVALSYCAVLRDLCKTMVEAVHTC